ncbi:hypothetical protein EDB80DRAFT_874797 [Ilyonectria destructans]|nr:hypothetical protein EDB80DRAFT_874797 [Ilyonectria destructans]
MRASFLNVILYAAFAVGFPSQHIEQRGEPATLDQATAADAPVEPPIAARSPTSDPGDSSDASSVAIALREAEPAGNDVLAVSVDEREIEARQYATLTWTHDPWKFKVNARGRHLIKMWSSGEVQFSTYFHAPGFWSYDYAIACALRDSGGRVYTLSRKGRIRGTVEPGSRTHAVDQTRYNTDVKTYWNDIIKGDKRMQCRVTMSNSISWSRLKELVGDVIDILKKVGGVVGAVTAIF